MHNPKVAMPTSPHDFQTLIFLHIPKTAGTSLRHVLARQYPPHETIELYAHSQVRGSNRYPYLDELAGEVRERCRLLSGHFNFGLHERMPGPCRYLAVLREPVSRVLSIYGHAREHADHPLHKAIADEGLGVRELLEIDANEYRNAQTRAVSGLDLPVFLATAPAEALALAKRNLDAHFVVCGLTERYDELLACAMVALGWKGATLDRLNVGRSGHQPASGPADAVRASIAEANQLDIELYRYAEVRFDQHIERLGRRFRRQLTRLRARERLVRIKRRLLG